MKVRFPGVTLKIEDLFLLEAFQIGQLTQDAPKRELAAVLHAYPDIQRFFITKNPEITPFITEIMKDNGPVRDQEQLNEFVKRVVWDYKLGWEIIKNKYPKEIDLRGQAGVWFLHEITSIIPLNEKVVIDVGAGTGNIAFTVVNESKIVFAVEPVTSLREFMREKAKQNGIANLFVVDGFSHEIPLPRDSVDVLITSNAIGFQDFDEELEEVERVVKPKGHAIHLIISGKKSRIEPIHKTLTSSKWNYQSEEVHVAKYRLSGGIKIKYWKQIY